MNERPAWKSTLEEGLVSGTIAALLSAGVLALAGRREAGSAVAPTNAESHWLWGDESLREDRVTLRHTLPGALTHHLSSVFWATLHAAATRGRPRRSAAQALAGGVATSAAAALVDYVLIPKRLTPGFEHRLSRTSTAAALGAIAAGIALGTLLLRGRR
jgi:hypothetical protein